MRLARSITDDDVAKRLQVLAANYLERAEALADAGQPRPEAVPQEMQQQQQQQPDSESEQDDG